MEYLINDRCPIWVKNIDAFKKRKNHSIAKKAFCELTETLDIKETQSCPIFFLEGRNQAYSLVGKQSQAFYNGIL